MQLPKLIDLGIEGKKVIVRADLDLPFEASAKEGVKTSSEKLKAESNNLRLEVLVPTINYLLEKQAKIILIGHRGRPEKEKSLSLSLREIGEKLSELLGEEIKFVDQVVGEKVNEEIKKLRNEEIVILENLRFDPREEENSKEFAKILASYADCYVNEAFAASHREHASIVGLVKVISEKRKEKSCIAAGLRFAQEVENLGKVLENPKKPVVIIISGIKEDKLSYLEAFTKVADKVLVAGRLPDIILSTNYQLPTTNIIVANLLPDKEDITIHSIEMFEKEIIKAGTVVVSGPIGKFEDEGHRQGTERVFKAIANSSAFKVAGGGDTIQAVNLLNLGSKFDWISVGGGAMLEYLAKGTLPGIEVLV
ncbi:hypothetical protein A2Z22_04885 [Candidatus Woesebacteria bacterium RBG_16_34_12]|uniref:Phosphoglycerate kinase n=1 Tax=Candidatus Woesebacteria bacterium RBG_16_34_12 TaxID=1802480 RepID=A0A1F7XC54_9BACT|nr:MAG: hypothetical protein A2Z22_04885 [Candidatus Woesebacteria bacterium RBG_16_34_12]